MYSFHLDCSLYYFCFRSDDSSHTYLVRLLVQPFCSFRGKVHEHLQGVPGGFIWLSKIRSVRLFPTKPHRLGPCRCSLFVPNSGRLATSSLFNHHQCHSGSVVTSLQYLLARWGMTRWHRSLNSLSCHMLLLRSQLRSKSLLTETKNLRWWQQARC